MLWKRVMDSSSFAALENMNGPDLNFETTCLFQLLLTPVVAVILGCCSFGPCQRFSKTETILGTFTAISGLYLDLERCTLKY